VVPKLGVNYPPGAIPDFLGGNAKPKPYCCSVLWTITANNFRPEMRKFFIEVIRHNRYLVLGNGSNNFGNHCPTWFTLNPERLSWQHVTQKVLEKNLAIFNFRFHLPADTLHDSNPCLKSPVAFKFQCTKNRSPLPASHKRADTRTPLTAYRFCCSVHSKN